MHSHNNVWLVKTELLLLLLGLPVLGLVWTFTLWQHARQQDEVEDSHSVRLGLRSTALAFAAYLIWLSISSLPPRYNSGARALFLVLLAITGTVAAGSGLLLTLLRARGSTRFTGTILALFALLYNVASGLALLVGGGAPG